MTVVLVLLFLCPSEGESDFSGESMRRRGEYDPCSPPVTLPLYCRDTTRTLVEARITRTGQYLMPPIRAMITAPSTNPPI